MAKKNSKHYVNNKEFSQAVVDYCTKLQEARENDQPLPQVPNYIAKAFLLISEGLSHNHNFVRYTYREEMVMDAVENCLRAIENYNIEAATRSGNPNAFGYFTQIAYFAFLRRIQKEKRQQDIKMKYLAESGIENYVMTSRSDLAATASVVNFVDSLKDRIDRVHEKDTELKVYATQQKAVAKARPSDNVDSGLEKYFED